MTYVRDEARIEKLGRKYEPKVARLFEQLASAFKQNGFEVHGPYSLHNDEPSWQLTVAKAGKTYELTIYLAVSEHRDGAPDGMSFLLEVTRDGTILGGFAPFNYTDRVWVPREDRFEVEERWSIFAHGVDPGAIVSAVTRS